MKQYPEKLMDRSQGNLKLRKTQNDVFNPFDLPLYVASLSLFPDSITCPGSKAAGCMDPCLKETGNGAIYPEVNEARKRKTQFFHEQKDDFLKLLKHELNLHDQHAKRTNRKAVVRLNVISDIDYENYGIPQAFPDVFFYDYTKRAARLTKPLPDNYQLMFSYSGRPQYRNQVLKAWNTGVPVAVVFRGQMPTEFLNRRVINGDKSDLRNVYAKNCIVGLSAKGPAKKDDSGFVVDTGIIARAA